MERTKSGALSYSMLLSSMLIFGTLGIWCRNIVLSSAVICAARGIVGASLIALFTKVKTGHVFTGIGRRNVLLLALSGVFIALNWMMLFEAYHYVTVPVATLCNYLEPTLLVLASPILLKEKLPVKKAICAAVAIAGIVLVSGVVGGEPLSATAGKGVALGLGSAFFYTGAVLINKKVTAGDVYERTIIQLFFAGVSMVPYVLVVGDYASAKPDAMTWISLGIVCVVNTALAYVLFFGSMKGLPAASIGILSYVDPVSTVVFSAIFLHETLTPIAGIGAVLLISAAILSEIRGLDKKSNLQNN